MSAAYRKRSAKSYLITVCHGGQRQYCTAKTEADAKALVREVMRLELNGVSVIESMRTARAVQARSSPNLAG